MGTRHLTAVYYKGGYRVAQYGQWDGYPSGQGYTVLRFLQIADLDAFRTQVLKTKWISSKEGRDLLIAYGADPDGDLVSVEIVNRIRKDHPELSRDTGAGILELVLNSKADPILLNDSLDFAADSLFCEWAYVIDLDANTFEVYKGFNEHPLAETDRFHDLKRDETSEYYPVKMVHKWPLDSLPSLDHMVTVCDPPDKK